MEFKNKIEKINLTLQLKFELERVKTIVVKTIVEKEKMLVPRVSQSRVCGKKLS